MDRVKDADGRKRGICKILSRTIISVEVEARKESMLSSKSVEMSGKIDIGRPRRILVDILTKKTILDRRGIIRVQITTSNSLS